MIKPVIIPSPTKVESVYTKRYVQCLDDLELDRSLKFKLVEFMKQQ